MSPRCARHNHELSLVNWRAVQYVAFLVNHNIFLQAASAAKAKDCGAAGYTHPRTTVTQSRGKISKRSQPPWSGHIVDTSPGYLEHTRDCLGTPRQQMVRQRRQTKIFPLATVIRQVPLRQLDKAQISSLVRSKQTREGKGERTLRRLLLQSMGKRTPAGLGQHLFPKSGQRRSDNARPYQQQAAAR